MCLAFLECNPEQLLYNKSCCKCLLQLQSLFPLLQQSKIFEFILDETQIKIGSELIWRWVAIGLKVKRYSMFLAVSIPSIKHNLCTIFVYC